MYYKYIELCNMYVYIKHTLDNPIWLFIKISKNMWDDRHFKMLQEKNPVIVQEKGGRWMINFTIQAFKHIGELGIGWEKRMEYGRLLPPPPNT